MGVTPKQHRRPYLVLSLGAFATGTDAAVIAGILPEIARDLRTSPTAVGLLVPAFALSYALFSPLLAALTEGSRQRALRVGMVGFAAANALGALAPGLAVLILARVVAAAGAGLYIPAAGVIAALSSPAERRGTSLSSVLAGGTVGAVAGVPLGTLLASHFGWRSTFWLVSGLAAVCFFTLGRWFQEGEETPRVIPLRERLRPLGDRAVALVLTTTALAFLAEFSVYAYIGVIAAREAGVGEHALVLLLLAFGVAGVCGNWLSGRAVDRLGPAPTLGTALGFLTVVLATFPLLDRHVATMFGGAALLGLAAWMITPPQQYRLVTLCPTAPAGALGLNQSALYLGIALAGPLGAVSLSFDGGRLDGILPALAALGALVLLAIGRSDRVKDP